MTEDEIKSHKRVFSRISLALFIYWVLAELVAFASAHIIVRIDTSLLLDPNFTMILGAAIQYVIAFPIFYVIIRRVSRSAPKKVKLSTLQMIGVLLVGMLFMYVGNSISTSLMMNIEAFLGHEVENGISSMMSETNVLLSALIVGLIGPIVEEIMFRKLLLDRLAPYGNVTAIIFTSLVFGLFHGNFYQLFYAFALGMIFAYVYLKTGKIIYTIIMHVFINMFCGVLPSIITAMLSEGDMTSPEYVLDNMLPITLLMLYNLVVVGMSIAGAVIFIKRIRKIKLSRGEVSLPKGRGAEVVLFNVGTILLVGLSVVMIILNTFY